MFPVELYHQHYYKQEIFSLPIPVELRNGKVRIDKVLVLGALKVTNLHLARFSSTTWPGNKYIPDICHFFYTGKIFGE